MYINVFLKNKPLQNWFEKMEKEINGFYKFKVHDSIVSLFNELAIIEKSAIIILDIQTEDYHHYTKKFINTTPTYKFIGVGIENACSNLIQILKNNINAYISINDNSFVLLQAINALENGKVYLNQLNIDLLVEHIINSDHGVHRKTKRDLHTNNLYQIDNFEKLTEKEIIVCKLLTQGLSYKEIALNLSLTSFAINQKAKSIYKKLNVRSRSELSYKLLH